MSESKPDTMNFDDVEISIPQNATQTKVLINGVEPEGLSSVEIRAAVGEVTTLKFTVHPKRVRVNGKAVVSVACSCPVKDLLSSGHAPGCPEVQP